MSYTKGRCPMLWVVAFVQFVILLLSGVTVSPSVVAAASFSVCPYMSASRGQLGSVSGNSNAIHKLVSGTSSALFPLLKVLNMKGGADSAAGSYGDIDVTDAYPNPTTITRHNKDMVPFDVNSDGMPGTPQVMRLGLSHKDASVSVREKLATAEKKLNELSTQLVNTPSIIEAMVLSTCNRFEIFIVATNPKDAAEHVYNILSDRTGGQITADTLRSTMRVIVGAKDTATHLLRVASGLDSIVLGEPQVLGQVKGAWEQAKNTASGGKAGKLLTSLFQSALKTVGRIRGETALSRGSMSVSSTAVGFSMGRLVNDLGLPSITKARIVVVGNGKMARLLLQNLQLQGVKDITVVCRTKEKVDELQDEIRQTTLHYRPMSDLTDAIANADILFPCTSAPEPIITPGMLQLALTPPNERVKGSSSDAYGLRVSNPFLSTLTAPDITSPPSSSSSSNSRAGKLNSVDSNSKPGTNDHRAALQIVDIAVPLNVHKDCNRDDLGVNVASYNVDDLKSIMAQNAAMRKNEVKEAERIIQEEVGLYLHAQEQKSVGNGFGRGYAEDRSRSCRNGGACRSKRSFRRG